MNSIAPRGGTATARITPRQAVTLAANGGLCLIDVRDISEIRATGKAIRIRFRGSVPIA